MHADELSLSKSENRFWTKRKGGLSPSIISSVFAPLFYWLSEVGVFFFGLFLISLLFFSVGGFKLVSGLPLFDKDH
jgi:hypothetical protein